MMENKLHGYADNSTLVAVVPSPGERAAVTMIESLFHYRSLFLRSFFGSMSCWSWSIAQQCAAQLPIHTLNYWTLLSRLLFSRWRYFLECNLAHRRSVAVLCMLFKIRSSPMNSLSGALPLPYVPARLLVVLWFICTRFRLLGVKLLSITQPMCPSQCFIGTILVSLCLMV